MIFLDLFAESPTLLASVDRGQFHGFSICRKQVAICNLPVLFAQNPLLFAKPPFYLQVLLPNLQSSHSTYFGWCLSRRDEGTDSTLKTESTRHIPFGFAEDDAKTIIINSEGNIQPSRFLGRDNLWVWYAVFEKDEIKLPVEVTVYDAEGRIVKGNE